MGGNFGNFRNISSPGEGGRGDLRQNFSNFLVSKPGRHNLLVAVARTLQHFLDSIAVAILINDYCDFYQGLKFTIFHRFEKVLSPVLLKFQISRQKIWFRIADSTVKI